MVLWPAALLAAVGILAGSAPASAAGSVALAVANGAPASLAAPLTPLAARRGGGFRTRSRSSRPFSGNRPVARRNPNTGRALRSFSRTLMRALGIAFLLSLLFGIGPGGSPLGLLLLLGLIALFVMSRRRRRQVSYR